MMKINVMMIIMLLWVFFWAMAYTEVFLQPPSITMGFSQGLFLMFSFGMSPLVAVKILVDENKELIEERNKILQSDRKREI